MITVLLVEDEAILAQIIKDTLEGDDFAIHTAADGEEGLQRFFALKPDVLVADVMMPRLDGFEMVRRIRRRDRHTPVLFLTARSAVADVVEGFELGANDYLKKPFSMQELMVRIKALAGRAADYGGDAAKAAPDSEESTFDIGSYHFNAVTQLLTSPGVSPQELSHREAEILRRLAAHPTEVVTTQSILLQLWGDDSFFNTRSLHVFITKLRRRLAADPRIRIVNVRGIGYKLIVGA
ncbi:MAG: response regulator transcription factor [Prevotellaceae bacterium]|jgi:DNA-binding response OmpR family regulator|nr:response regulator transcription factor [Prevotellaceae bacterium]